MMAKRLAPMHIGNVHFDDGKIAGTERIGNGERSVGECGRVDDDAARGGARLVDPVDEDVFVVALVEANVELELRGKVPAGGRDIVEGFPTVDMRLAFAEEVEVRAVEDVNEVHLSSWRRTLAVPLRHGPPARPPARRAEHIVLWRWRPPPR